MNVLKFELKQEIKSALLWGILLAGLLVFFNLFYPSFKEEADAFNEMIKLFPKEVMAGIGINIDNLFTLEGYYSYVNNYLNLALGIYGLSLALKTHSREKMNTASDFLFSKPMSKTKIFINKVLANVILSWLVFLLMFGSLILVLHLNETNLTNTLFKLFGSGFILLSFFYGFGTLMSAFVKRVKNPIGLSTTIVFSFYVLMMLARVLENDLLKKLSPFGYVDQGDILMGKSFSWWFILIVIAMVIMAGFTVVRRDVETG